MLSMNLDTGGHTSEQGEEALLGGAQILVGGTGNLQVNQRNNADSLQSAARAQSPKWDPLFTLLPREEDFLAYNTLQ